MIRSPVYFVLLAALAGAASFRVGWRFPGRIVLPCVQGLAGWGAFLLAWEFVGLPWAAAAVGAWAAGTSAVALYAFESRPVTTDERVFRSREYRLTMVDWLRTGRGPESQPRATALAHARELVAYAAAAVVSANLVSIVMGAVLLNYMNAYVASLWRAARSPRVVLWRAWHPWSVVRVAAYIALGASLAPPVARAAGWTLSGRGAVPLAVAGGLGVVADLALKLWLSARWSAALREGVDLEAAGAGRAVSRAMDVRFDIP